MSLQPSEKGQGLVEYALITGLIAVSVMAVLLLVGPSVSNLFQLVINSF